MASYHHFTQEERTLLSALRRKSLTQEAIARELTKSQSAISRELKRNRTNGIYHAYEAKRKVEQRQQQAQQPRRRIENDPWLRKYVIKKLKKSWSPEQITGRVRKDHNIIVCHETIYKYIYHQRPDLKKYLRCKKGRYRRRYGAKIRVKQREELKKTRIDQRPKVIEERARLGDFEGDTIVGQRGSGSLITYVDRHSGYTLIDYVPRATAQTVRETTIQRFNRLPRSTKYTITYDNGSEFEDHELIARETKMDIYFAYPYHSWERGTNENTNGLIRQFFPKQTSFIAITQKDTMRVERLLNTRPRKRLAYLTPTEVFRKNMRLT